MSPLELSSRRPLTALQTSMLLASTRNPQAGVYIVQDVCETPESLDLERLQRAWRVVAGRHTALRTTIEVRAERPPVQCVAEIAELRWGVTDWTALSAEECK